MKKNTTTIIVSDGDKQEFSVLENEHLILLDIRLNESIEPIHVSLEERGAQCSLYGLYLGNNDSTSDMKHFIEHKAEETESTIVSKVVLSDKASLTYDGAIQMNAVAKQSKGSQKADVLLLSADAKIHTEPNLIIANKQVQCSHGVTITNVNKEKQFYLQSRGIETAEATRLMVRAHIEPVLEHLPDTERESFETSIASYGY